MTTATHEGAGGGVAMQCYDNTIPTFAEHELDRLYGGRYASLPHFRIYGPERGVSTFVAHSTVEVLAVYLYRREGRSVVVLNEGIRVDQRDASRFAHHVFNTYPDVHVVRFNFVEAVAGAFRRPCQVLSCGQDLVLPLPPSVQQYTASLGSSTRSTIKNRLNRLRRDHPGFRFDVVEQDAVKEADIRAIIAMNRARMQTLDKQSAIDSAEEQRIIEYVRACGFVCIASIDGRLVAGAINYRIGRNFSARILAHDAQYDEQRIGFLCAYLSICECIKQGGDYFYFGWGDGAYKFHLGAQPRQLSRLILYRSRLHVLGSAGMACKAWVAGQVYAAVQAVRDAARTGERNASAILARKCVEAVRAIKAARSPFQG